MKIAGLTVLLFFFCTTSKAQEKTLKEVRIKHKKERGKELNDERLKSFAPGLQIVTIDSQLLAQYALQNLGQLLAQQAPVFIKSYGINSLATLNFRGSSSAQSQVLWNGVPLNNASLGMADVSLFTVHNFDDVHIAYGGSSALLGSGNVGAALLLDNRFEAMDSAQKWHTHLAAEAASFGQYKLSLKEEYSKGKLFVSTKLSAQSAQNNFAYLDQNNVAQKMQNAQLKSLSGMLNLGYHFNARTQLNFSAWGQYFDRHIPPALFENISTKTQQDQSLRFLLEFKKETQKQSKLYSKTAFILDEMHYSDEAIKLATNNTSFQFYEELGWRKSIDVHNDILVFVPVSIAWTQPQNDSANRIQSKIALAVAYKYQGFRQKLTIALNTRLEQINEQTVFLPGINASYSLFHFLCLRANVQRSYRAPTLNEWYYQPGGNPKLKPEQGWSEDAGYELKISIGKSAVFTQNVSVFNRQINDWILWFGGSIWTPHNIAQVHSRGVESLNSFLYKKGNWKFNFGLNTSFVLATTQQSYIPNDGSIGKQIPYSPRYNGQTNLGLGFKKLYASYNHTYTGYRFTTTDESQFLQPYQTGNFYASYDALLAKINFKVSMQCNNLWNKQYQVVQLRPMPGRNFALGFSVVF